MKKNERKVKSLHLNRETLVRLTVEALAKVEGGVVEGCTGCDSGCGIYAL